MTGLNKSYLNRYYLVHTGSTVAGKMDATNKKRFLLLYGSQTGQAKSIAEIIAEKATKAGLSPDMHCFSESEKGVWLRYLRFLYKWADRVCVCARVNLFIVAAFICTFPPLSRAQFQLEGEHVTVMVVSTTGEGEPPDTVAKFWRKLRRMSGTPLEQCQYALLGQRTKEGVWLGAGSNVHHLDHVQVLHFVIWDFSFLSIILTTITITYTLHHHSHHHCHLQPSPQALTSSILTSSTHLFHHLTPLTSSTHLPSPHPLTSSTHLPSPHPPHLKHSPSITSPPHLKHSPLPSPHPLTSSTHLFHHLTPSPQALTSSITSLPITSSTHLFHHLTPSPQALTSSITSLPITSSTHSQCLLQ